jgi:hypothetical protein
MDLRIRHRSEHLQLGLEDVPASSNPIYLGSRGNPVCGLSALLTAAVTSSPQSCPVDLLLSFFMQWFVYSLSCCLLPSETLGGLGSVASSCLDLRFWFFSWFWFFCERDYFCPVCFERLFWFVFYEFG